MLIFNHGSLTKINLKYYSDILNYISNLLNLSYLCTNMYSIALILNIISSFFNKKKLHKKIKIILLTFEAKIPPRPMNCVQLQCATVCFHKNLLCSNLFEK